MDPRQLVKLSKYLSKHLRHCPQRIGLTLAPGGWVPVRDLLDACNRNGMPITMDQLSEVVARNDKQRLSFDDTKENIRANQGHTVDVDLQLEPRHPPVTLFHGTAEQLIAPIMQAGLLKMARHHVHLSADVATAHKVGARHGRPVVLRVDAAAMHSDGHAFFLSDNGVWLVDHVPVQYLARMG